jgi:hypothetical protein
VVGLARLEQELRERKSLRLGRLPIAGVLLSDRNLNRGNRLAADEGIEMQ